MHREHRLTTFNFDAFGDPVQRVNGKAQTTATDSPELHCDGVYDPALALYYLPIQPHPHLVGLSTGFESHEGQLHDPASLAKFMYAGQTPVDSIDPA